MIHSTCEWASDVWCLASCFNNSLLFQTINLSGRCEAGTDQWWGGVTWDGRWGDGDTGWHLSLLTPSHSCQVFTPPLPGGSQVSRPWPGLAHSRHSVVVESDPGPPANQRPLSWPVDQSEAGTVLPTGSVRPGLAAVSGPVRAGPAWSESVPSQTQHGEALTHQPSHITRNIDHIHTCRQHSSRQCKQWA